MRTIIFVKEIITITIQKYKEHDQKGRVVFNNAIPTKPDNTGPVARSPAGHQTIQDRAQSKALTEGFL
jgi:hypothetical protein